MLSINSVVNTAKTTVLSRGRRPRASLKMRCHLSLRDTKQLTDERRSRRQRRGQNLLRNKPGRKQKSDSLRTKLHNTEVGRVMLSHDASLRKSEAARSRVAFSTSMN